MADNMAHDRRIRRSTMFVKHVLLNKYKNNNFALYFMPRAKASAVRFTNVSNITKNHPLLR